MARQNTNKSRPRRVNRAATAQPVASASAGSPPLPSEICDLKSRVPNPQSAIRNPQSAIPLIQFRPHQQPIFEDRSTGVLILCWSRQIGKSFTLAAWAVDRLLTRPGRLVTVLSNSRENGAEVNLKCAEICQKLGTVYEQEDLSTDLSYDSMNMETRITVEGKVGRIKVLAANPRTARGFSGDLLLDEFDFHENQRAIWEAAEPILSSNPDFLCRIASTLNGRRMLWEMMHSGLFKVSLVRRSDAYRQGLKIYHPVTRVPITPEEARALALDKRAYDQNYECIPGDETSSLLSSELITQAEYPDAGVICAQDWSGAAQDFLLGAKGDLFLGVDVGRNRDLTVMSAFERVGHNLFARAVLCIENMRLPDQQKRLDFVCRMPRFRRACVDMTGIGLGLVEYAQQKWGGRVAGINFAASVPLTRRIAAEGRKSPTVRVTEAMAVELLAAYEDRRIRQPADGPLRDDLRKPGRVTTPGGRVSIAAERDDSGHADRFWSFALAVEAAHDSVPFAAKPIQSASSRLERPHVKPRRGILV